MSKWRAFAIVRGRRAAISLSAVVTMLAILGVVVLVSAQTPAVTADKTASPARVQPNTSVQYTVIFTNESDSDQTIEAITDTLPADFTYVDMTASSDISDGGPAKGSTGTIVWSGFTADTVPQGGTLSLIYTVMVEATEIGPYENSVRARLAGGEIVEAVSATVTLIGVELSGEKSASAEQVRVGDPLEYEVELTNSGNTTATLTSIVDTLPAAFLFDGMVSGLPEPTVAGDELTWSGPIEILAGETLEFRYRVIAGGTPGDSPSNTLVATYNGETLELSEDVLLLERIFYIYLPLAMQPTKYVPPYRLAYDDYPADNFEISAIDADGSDWLNVSNEAGGDSDPDWSPDGTKLAWVHFYDGKGDIIVSNADGTGKVNLTNHAMEDRAPAWSPDGTKIAFHSTRQESRREVYVMDANGSNVTRLTYHSCQSHDPVWSPDGTKIAYICGLDDPDERVSYMDIFVMAADGQSFTRLTHDEVPDEAIDWSPDSKYIAYVHYYEYPRKTSDIWMVDVETGTRTRLTFTDPADYSPAWSPDGTKIVFSTLLNGTYDIAVMDADGSNIVDLTNAPKGDFVPRWSPDGTMIAFISTRDAQRALYVMNADGTGQTWLDSVPDPLGDSVYIPDWKPQ
jgi:uncharacterized repeat protein (TIGR01451 family)